MGINKDMLVNLATEVITISSNPFHHRMKCTIEKATLAEVHASKITIKLLKRKKEATEVLPSAKT